MSAQSSPMTRSAAAKLRSKRKSDSGTGPSDDAAVDAPAGTSLRIEIEPLPRGGARNGPTAKRRKLPVRAKDDGDRPKATAADTLANKPTDNEDEHDEHDEHNNNKEEVADSDADSDEADEDSDDAPEAISTTQAAAATRASAQRASKAVEQRATEQKRKRQQRDARLKEQAAVRKAREKVEAATAAKAEAAAAAAAAEEEAQRQQERQKKAAEAEAAAAAAVRTAGTQAVSKLLPLEFLESDEESDDDDDNNKNTAKATNGGRSASTKTAASSSGTALHRPRPRRPAHPRDRQLGTTVYRVLTDAGPRALAPKAGKHARNMQEELLRRKRVARPAMRGGFLVRR
ncbi:u3 snoRNA associated protein [Niveomyces insectorum RCEF 264]|uniref:U3 snoRNA associated protein n=1 Tax=Niveomyces insectorum RCEF 264 TaxID=1081102 RepID=A0A167MA35_9HYPO|nr:u3 snoRNA associated protein [Niveomyces insectorum RCEF 264]